MSQSANHVQEEELEQYCLGSLAEVGRARLEEHLLLCETCRDRLTETETFIASMRHASRQWRKENAEQGAAGVIAGRAWRERWPGRLVPALVIAALVLVCAALWSGRHPCASARLPFAVELTALRGTAPGLVPAGRPLVLELDLTGLNDVQPLTGQVVDGWGSRVAEFPVGSRARLKALPPGDYFVRIYRASGELLREYALTVKP